MEEKKSQSQLGRAWLAPGSFWLRVVKQFAILGSTLPSSAKTPSDGRSLR